MGRLGNAITYNGRRAPQPLTSDSTTLKPPGGLDRALVWPSGTVQLGFKQGLAGGVRTFNLLIRSGGDLCRIKRMTEQGLELFAAKRPRGAGAETCACGCMRHVNPRPPATMQCTTCGALFFTLECSTPNPCCGGPHPHLTVRR